MQLLIDEDVKVVAEFMQERISASRLVSVAEGVARIGRILWEKYQPEEIAILRLVSPAPTSGLDQNRQSAASE